MSFTGKIEKKNTYTKEAIIHDIWQSWTCMRAADPNASDRQATAIGPLEKILRIPTAINNVFKTTAIPQSKTNLPPNALYN